MQRLSSLAIGGAFTYRHQIAQGLILVALLLKHWPTGQELLAPPKRRRAAKSQRK